MTANAVLGLIVGLGLVGLAGIVGGVFALRSVARLSRGDHHGSRAAQIAAIVVGLIIGLASWPLTYWMGYSIPTSDGPARLVGLPFFVASFDKEGRDYVSDWTLWACVGNVLFWFMVPQIALAFYRRYSRSGRRRAAA